MLGQAGRARAASAREIFLFELARRYSFDDDAAAAAARSTASTSHEGPLEALLRFNPSDDTSLKLEADYNTLFSGLASTALSGSSASGTATRSA